MKIKLLKICGLVLFISLGMSFAITLLNQSTIPVGSFDNISNWTTFEWLLSIPVGAGCLALITIFVTVISILFVKPILHDE